MEEKSAPVSSLNPDAFSSPLPDRASASRLIRTIRQAGGNALNPGKIGPKACLGQKFNLPSELRGLIETDRDPMQTAAARDLDLGNVCKRNYLFGLSSSNFQVILAIHHLVGKTMDRRLMKKIRHNPAENAYRTPIWHRVSPQTAVEHRRNHHKRDQRGGAEPYSALEQNGALKRDDLHGSVDPHRLAQGLHC